MKKFNVFLAVVLSLVFVFQSFPLSAEALAAVAEVTDTAKGAADSADADNSQPVRILSEDISKREENVKHFKMSDGTYRAEIYASPVHYLDNGQWKEVDNSIKPASSTKNGSGYTASVSGVGFFFPDKLTTGEKIEIEKNGHKLSFAFMAEGTSLFSSSKILSSDETASGKTNDSGEIIENRDEYAVKNGALRYSNVSGGTDIEYELNSSVLKESIIINSQSSEYVYEFNVDMGELTPVVNDNGSISLVDTKNENKAEYIISAPFMFDAKGLFSDAVTMKLELTKSGYVLTVTADEEWINDSERAFPVTIDPTILYIPHKVNDIFDTYVDSGTPNVNHYLSTYSIIGHNSLGTGRAYIKFNLPELSHCGVIVNATLGLIQLGYDPGNGVTNHMAVYESPESDETYDTLTWNNHPSLASQPIIDYTVFRSGENASVFYTLNITKIAKKWFEDGVNNGLYLKSVNENSSWRSTIYTSNFSGYDAYPMVSISYIDNVGLEGYWSYETLELGRSGTAYINQYNGLLTYVHQDINLGGNITYLSAAHVYSNNYGTSAPYGYGFRLSAQETITLLSENSELYKSEEKYRAYLTDADGTAHYFRERTENEWYFEFDDNLILVKTDTGYELRYDDGSKKIFDSSGRLTKIIDRNGNTITQAYDTSGRITKITDATGRKITFTYSGNYLSSTKDHAGRLTTYTYSGGYLDTITYPDGKTTKFTYSINKLYNIKQADSGNVTFSYPVSNRVSAVSVKGTNSNSLRNYYFEYKGSNTVITDNQGRKLTVGFDNMGRAVSYTDKDGNVSTTKYNNSGNKNNTVAAASDTFSFSDNKLLNHSFESSTNNWAFYFPTGSHSYAVTSEAAYVGSSSLKLTRSASGALFAYQDIWSMSVGKTYTFSVYVKTANMTNCHAGIHIEGRTSSAALVSYADNYVSETHANGWSRLQVQYTVPEGVAFLRPIMYLEGSTGTAYFDAAQFEEASSAGHYNLLTNPGFARYSSNAFSGWTATGNVSADTGKINSSQCAAITGTPGVTMNLMQTVQLGNSSNQRTIVFGAATAGNCTATSNSTATGARYELKIELYAGTSLISNKSIEYNSYAIDTAQLLTDSITVDSGVTSAKVYLIFNKNVNTVYFDNAFVYLDNYGTKYEYDDDGKLILSSNNAGDAISYEYDGIDIEKISVKKNGEETDSCEYEYDSNHNITKETTKSGIITEYNYPTNNKGVPESVVVKNADGSLQSSVSYTYVLFSNYTRYITDARGMTQSYYYNSSKDLLESYTDENGVTTNYTYDDLSDELTRVYITVDNVTYDVNYSYNTNGYLSSISQSGVSYGFTYDVYGRRTATKVGSQNLASYSYNSRGLLGSTTYGNGTVHSLTYDESDRLISEAYDGTTAYTYSYNTEGYLGKTVDIPLGITTYYDYDLVGRVTNVNSSNGVSSNYMYNEHNTIESYTVKKNNTFISGAEYTYDSDGLLSDVTLSSANGAYFVYSYDSLNRLTDVSHDLSGFPLQVEYSYLPGNSGNTTGLVSSILYSDGGYRYMPKLSYTYDNKGNIKTVSENDVLHITYTYDNLDRLVREDNKDLNKTITYTYDTRGNILKKEFYAYTTGTLGSVQDTITYTYDSTWKDKLTSYDGETIAYDSIGNPTTYGSTTLTWEKGRQLKSAGNVSFKYNIDGLRTQKKTSSVTTDYIWSSGLLMQQSDGTNTLKFSYSPDGRALEVDFNGTAYYYIYNLQGDVIGLYNINGLVVVEYTYDSWGKLISTTGSLANTLGKLNPFRYRGYIYDEETALYYVSSRYYDPEIGRFINADTTDILTATPMGLTDKNLFAYCDNNPIVRIDRNGQVWIHIALGAGISGVSSFISTFVTTGNIADSLISLAFGAVEGGLSAALPNFSPLFGAVFSGIESAVIDWKNGVATSDLVINATVSAGFGGLSGFMDNYFSSDSFFDDLINVNKLKKNFHAKSSPKAKKEAVKAMTDFKKKCFKEVRLSAIEFAGYTALEEGTKWYGRSAYSYVTR